MADPSVRFPKPATLDWVAKAAGGVRVVGGRRMTGGLTSSIHRVTVVDRSGTRRHVVLRRWVGREVDRGQHHARREGEVLDLLSGSDIPAPRLIAVSDGSETDRVPAVLMSRVPGHMLLTPSDPAAWLRQMAELLPRVHALDVRAALDRYEPRARAEPVPAPQWVSRKAVWDAAQEVLLQPPPVRPRCFTHADYQHFNMLWRREKLTGIVDWTWPGFGPPDFDVGHCRLNLAVLHSPDWAEEFRLAYEAIAGRAVEPWFDLYRLCAFSSEWPGFIPLQAGGRARVDTAGMPARVEELISRVLKRM